MYVWKVYAHTAGDDEAEVDAPEPYAFTNERAAIAFERWARGRFEVVVGPYRSSIYRSAKWAIVDAKERPR